MLLQKKIQMRVTKNLMMNKMLYNLQRNNPKLTKIQKTQGKNKIKLPQINKNTNNATKRSSRNYKNTWKNRMKTNAKSL